MLSASQPLTGAITAIIRGKGVKAQIPLALH
jgi:hypothetical protein